MASRMGLRAMGNNKHPLSDRSWWQVGAIAAFSFGLLGTLIGLLPTYSSSALAVGLSLATVATAASLWNWRTYAWAARSATSMILSLMIFLLASRSLASVLGPMWMSVLLLLLVYLVSWLLPIVAPRLSARIWREQMTPQTRLGRGCLALSIAVAPVAGVLGASVGLFGHRFGQGDAIYLVGGLLAWVGALGISFAASHQLWPERPWGVGQSK